jgi:uncharacterized protein with PIN domain
MVFGFFGPKKKKETMADLLAEVLTYQQLLKHLAKAQSLQKLDRKNEADQVVQECERMLEHYLSQNRHDKDAHMMLALFYYETGMVDRAETLIDRLLKSAEFQLTDQERLILSGELQKIRRERPLDRRPTGSPEGFTQVYCCQNCGRLHNFVSMPCPHCDWSPQTFDEAARSIVLSNSHFKIPDLLVLSREISKGRRADDVVPNLRKDGQTYLTKANHAVEQVFSLLRQNEHKNHRSLKTVRECANCGGRVLFSGAEECEECRARVNWPDAVRALACMDNLLWLLEQRVEVSSSREFSDFVCVLVSMTNNLLRKQEPPSDRYRKYILNLLASMTVISDMNNGAVIETKNPRDLKIYLVKDKMRNDSETFGLFLFRELELFIEKMIHGIRI